MRTRDRNHDEPCTARRLRALLAAAFPGESIVVLANREPLRHERTPDGDISIRRSGGGLVAALEPVVRACSGVWVASGSGTGDREVVDAHDRLCVSPSNRPYWLRRVWLDAVEERGYYGGFANEGLWPLCHQVGVAPTFRADDFKTYAAVNTKFANAVCQEAQGFRPLILVQDYHFALAPQAIRARLPLSTIATFWHIPWPDLRTYACCPWGRHLLRGLLGSSIVGFQTGADCQNFMHCVESSLNAKIDRQHRIIAYDGRQIAVKAYPVSVEFPSPWARLTPPVDTCRMDVRRQLGLPSDMRLIVGVDRLDYSKGLDWKICAIERLLERHPEFRERLVLAQIVEPSRTSLAAYRDYHARVVETTRRVNIRFGTDRYRPIILLDTRHEPPDVYRFLRAADVCYVGSLHDGMNLVAKEFVAARDDHQGVLVLSRFAGAARELTTALIVDPLDLEACADTVATALRMPLAEQAVRLRAMRSVVARYNTYRWAENLLTDAGRLRADLKTAVTCSGQPGWGSRVPA